ncbi:MAG: hypothetical protein V1765_02060 [bacterium]
MFNYKNQIGSAILTTIFLLVGMIALGFVGIEIMLSGFSSYMTQEASTQAYYAAEAGVERALTLHKYYAEQNNNASFYHDKDCGNGRYVSFGSEIITSTCGAVGNTSTTKAILPAIDNLITFKRQPPSYEVRISFSDSSDPADQPGRIIHINSRGRYLNTAREIQVTFCSPLCDGSTTKDGCGGYCD